MVSEQYIKKGSMVEDGGAIWYGVNSVLKARVAPNAFRSEWTVAIYTQKGDWVAFEGQHESRPAAIEVANMYAW